MKKFVTLLAALAFLSGAAVQAQTPTAKMGKSGKMGHGKMHHDHMMMHDGKMMSVKDGKATPMTETMPLPNGTQVMVDGTVMMKDGKKMMLKEGQEIGTDGKVHADDMDHKKLHDGKMKGKM